MLSNKIYSFLFSIDFRGDLIAVTERVITTCSDRVRIHKCSVFGGELLRGEKAFGKSPRVSDGLTASRRNRNYRKSGSLHRYRTDLVTFRAINPLFR